MYISSGTWGISVTHKDTLKRGPGGAGDRTLILDDNLLRPLSYSCPHRDAARKGSMRRISFVITFNLSITVCFTD